MLRPVAPNFTVKDLIMELAAVNRTDRIEFTVYNPSLDSGERFDAKQKVVSLPVGDFETLTTPEFNYRMAGKDEVVAVTSRVGTALHMPQIDFSCPKSPENLQRAVDYLHFAGHAHGFLVESGRSYHFHGRDPINEKTWNDFMNRLRATRISYLLDREWAAHCQERGYSALRISGNQEKKFVPAVLGRLDDKQQKLPLRISY
jgi:hypothetical protein